MPSHVTVRCRNIREALQKKMERDEKEREERRREEEIAEEERQAEEVERMQRLEAEREAQRELAVCPQFTPTCALVVPA